MIYIFVYLRVVIISSMVSSHISQLNSKKHWSGSGFRSALWNTQKKNLPPHRSLRQRQSHQGPSKREIIKDDIEEGEQAEDEAEDDEDDAADDGVVIMTWFVRIQARKGEREGDGKAGR